MCVCVCEDHQPKMYSTALENKLLLRCGVLAAVGCTYREGGGGGGAEVTQAVMEQR